MNTRFSLNHEGAHERGCTMKDPTIKCREHVMESNRKMPRSPQESSQPYMIAEESDITSTPVYRYLLMADTTEPMANNTTTVYKQNQMANTHVDNRHYFNQGAI